MTRARALAVALAAVWSAPAAGASDGQCLLCGAQPAADASLAPGADSGRAPLEIELYSGFNFHRLPIAGAGGDMLVDSGSQYAPGAADMARYGLVGRVVIQGAPNAGIYVDMPPQIVLLSKSGSRIPIERLTTTLAPSPRLDANGRLEFSFGGALTLPAGAVPGDYRASFRIDASYQ